MLDLPPNALDEYEVLADWVELCTLVDSAGTFSQSALAEVLSESGLKGDTATPSSFDAEEHALAEDAFEGRDVAVRFAQNVWRELAARQQSTRRGYPFRVDGDLLRRRVTTWRDVPAFSMLLLADIGRRYKATNTGVEMIPDSAGGRLFEKIVEASLTGLVRGRVVRFGWPCDEGWPTGIEDRIRYLAEQLELETEKLDGKTHPNEKDRGLDIVAQIRFPDSRAGSIVFLAQCAVGKNWRKKIGEPALDHWRDIFQWNAQLLRMIAVPWRLAGLDDIKRVHRLFGAVVMDRARLCAGNPDKHLDPVARPEILRWCKARIAKIPTLASAA